MNASGVVQVSESGELITCSVAMGGATFGYWNVVVTNPDNRSFTLPNAFKYKSPCGNGGGVAVLTQGLLGLLSVAGGVRSRKRFESLRRLFMGL
jgi:hypothetical protein